jgi:hypothetical protein
LRPSRLSEHVRAHNWFAVAIDFVIVVLGVYVVATLEMWARCLDDRLREPSKAGVSCRPSVGGTIDVGGRK